MNLQFAAVVILMVLMIAFAMIVLHGLAVSAGIRIRADMVKLLGSYDRIIEEKSREIRRLQKELEAAEAKRAAPVEVRPPVPAAERTAPAAVPIPEAAEYRHTALGGSYETIRDHFALSGQERQDLVELVAQRESGTRRGAAAAALRAALSYETVYRMALLAPEEQLRILDTSLSDEDWTLLRDFCGERGDAEFSVTRFCDWLEERSMLESGEVRVRDSRETSPDGQPRICEGVQIMAGGRLYDYSINESEIS